MPTVSKKVTNFPGLSNHDDDLDQAVANRQPGADPLKEINSMISQLQEAAREARASLQIAEDERDRFAAELAAERDLHRQQNFKHKQALAEMEAELGAVDGLRDEIARVRQEAAKASDESKRAAQVAQRKLDEATKQRDAAVPERDSLRKELEAAKKQMESANKDRSAALKESAELKRNADELTTALADARKQLAALRQARDTASNTVSTMKVTISRLEDHIAELTDRCEMAEEGMAKVPAAATPTQSASATEELEVMRAEIELLNSHHESRMAEITARHQSEIAELKMSIEIAQPGPPVQSAPQSDADIAKLKAEVAMLKPKAEDFEVLTGRFERQRLETIELSTMLENAHRDIRELGASLAEARLLLKAGGVKFAMDGKAAAAQAAPRARGESGGKKILRTMRRAAQGLIENPADAGILAELFDHSMALAGESEKHGGEVLRRVADAFASLLCEAQSMPEQVTPALVRTLNQTLDFLDEALDKPPGELSGALDDARAFVVDDDVQASEIITSAFQSVGISAKASPLPGEAIGELTVNRYDLIVLDVGLPEIDGFELCTHIRTMEKNAHTPILFLSGDASMERRGEATRSGGDDFVSKPFNVSELGLRGLLHVLRTRLQIG